MTLSLHNVKSIRVEKMHFDFPASYVVKLHIETVNNSDEGRATDEVILFSDHPVSINGNVETRQVVTEGEKRGQAS